MQTDSLTCVAGPVDMLALIAAPASQFASAMVSLPTLGRWAMLLVGVLLTFSAFSSVIRCLVMTRGVSSTITTGVAWLVRSVFVAFAQRSKHYQRRDWIQAWIAPLTLVSFLGAWLITFLAGYSLIIASGSSEPFASSIRQAGSSLFTLGFAAAHDGGLTYVDFIAAATGPIVIGLLIGYLPALYASYNRREVAVALLCWRAGTPNWGPELLARQMMNGASQEQLEDLWSEWEIWAADVSESHTSYPTLISTRSAHPDQNWLVSLLAVMDSAALQLALRPYQVPFPPRVVIRQGTACLMDLAERVKVKVPELVADRTFTLSYSEYQHGIARLAEVKYPQEVSIEESWPVFAAWRLNYEQVAYALLKRIDAVPALWSGPRRTNTVQCQPQPAPVANLSGYNKAHPGNPPPADLEQPAPKDPR